MEVSNTKYRFRILNASNARRYELALDPSEMQRPLSSRSVATGDFSARRWTHRTIRIARPSASMWWWTSRNTRLSTEVTLKNLLGDGKSAT
jgi:spore coat protein A